MDCIVYILGSPGRAGRDERYLTYVGWTLDLDRRLLQHNSGKGAKSTRGRVWQVLHVERFATRNEAMSREWHLKRDRAFRKSLVEAVRSGGSTLPVPKLDTSLADVND